MQLRLHVFFDAIVAAQLCVSFSAGCQDSQPGGQPEASIADSAEARDQGLDAPATVDELALAAIVDSIELPTKENDFAVDLDGTGKKNRLKELDLEGTALSFFNLQDEVDAQIARGEFVLLFEIFAESIADDPSVNIRSSEGKDLNGDPADNFSGDATFRRVVSSSSEAMLAGKIAAGALSAGPGDFSIPLPFGPLGAVMVRLERAVIKADLGSSKSAMTAGQVNGAIPKEEVEATVVPTLADLLTYSWMSATIPLLKVMLASMDTNKNGKIDNEEVRSHDVFGRFVEPDIDLDGDKTPDAVSIGYGFSATRCKIDGGV